MSPTFGFSAREGTGLERLLEAVESEPVKRDRMMDMDYVTYAEGEAELGWLNCQIQSHPLRQDLN